MGRELGEMIEVVRRMCGASGTTAGTILIAVWLLGYRRVADAMPVPPIPGGPPFAEPAHPEVPPGPTPGVDEIYTRLGTGRPVSG